MLRYDECCGVLRSAAPQRSECCGRRGPLVREPPSAALGLAALEGPTLRSTRSRPERRHDTAR